MLIWTSPTLQVITEAITCFGALEFFSLKVNVSKSGSKVLNNNAEFHLTNAQASSVTYTLIFFAQYGSFLVINPEAGITIEFNFSSLTLLIYLPMSCCFEA